MRSHETSNPIAFPMSEVRVTIGKAPSVPVLSPTSGVTVLPALMLAVTLSMPIPGATTAATPAGAIAQHVGHLAHERHLAHLHAEHLRHLAVLESRRPWVAVDPGVGTPSRGTPSGEYLTCEGLEALWVAAGGSTAVAFLAAEIAMAESGGYQYATGPVGERGFWQINPDHGSLSTYDRMGNARAAIIISDDGRDWSPWTTYTSGAYAGRCLPVVTSPSRLVGFRRLARCVGVYGPEHVDHAPVEHCRITRCG